MTEFELDNELENIVYCSNPPSLACFGPLELGVDV